MKNKKTLIITLCAALFLYVSISRCAPETIILIIQKINISDPENILGTLILKDIPLTTSMKEIKNQVSRYNTTQDSYLHWTSNIQLLWINNDKTYYLDNEDKTIGDYISQYHMHDPYNPLPLRGITLKLLVPNL